MLNRQTLAAEYLDFVNNYLTVEKWAEKGSKVKHPITQQQMDNLLEAQKFWATVPPDSVNLDSWREFSRNDGVPQCGSAACFGGWLPYADHFTAQGVFAGSSGQPLRHARGVDFGGVELSFYLFGWSLFAARGGLTHCGTYHGADSPKMRDAETGTDYDAVTKRLEFAIENSEVKA